VKSLNLPLLASIPGLDFKVRLPAASGRQTALVEAAQPSGRLAIIP
jgi:hypothetical protein